MDDAPQSYSGRMKGVGGCRCHPKWRQIGRLESVNFEDSTHFQDHDLLPGGTIAAVDFGTGERILTAVDWANKKIQLLTLLPQLCPLLISGDNFTHRKKIPTTGKLQNVSKTENLEGPSEQFLRDLCILADWPYSKKCETTAGGVITTAEDGRVVPTVDERGHEDHGGMCRTHKKVEVLRRDKFLCQFLRDLLAVSITAPQSHDDADVDPDTMLIPDVFPPPPPPPKPSIVKLLKMGLKSFRYSSHLRKSLKEMDVQATMCILSIINNTCTSNNEMEEDRPALLELSQLPSQDDAEFKSVIMEDTEEGSSSNNKVQTEKYNPSPESSENNNGMLSSETVMKYPDLFQLPKQHQTIDSTNNLEHFEYFKIVLQRVFKFLKCHPENMFRICQVIDSIQCNPNNINTVAMERNVHPSLRGVKLQEFLQQMQRLRNSFTQQINHGEIEPVANIQSLEPTFVYWTKISLSKKIVKLEKILSDSKLKHNTIFTRMEMEIRVLEEKLEVTKAETEKDLFETVKKLEANKVLENNQHNQRLEKLEGHVENRERRLLQAISILETGYKGLRSYRKSKEAELHQIIHEYDDVIIKQRLQLYKLSKLVKANDKEIQRLDEVQLGMADTYEEMKNTKRLKELLQNLQMAEAVKENWAARRIQTAWKKYKARKLRKRKLKKPKRKKKEDVNVGHLVKDKKSQAIVVERRKFVKTEK